MNTPVVLFIFNRPATTRRVVDAIRAMRPPQLFVFADGPRSAADNASCDAARAVVDDADWSCQVVKDYSEANLGLRWRVVGGLNRVFADVETALILEDDCLPEPSFGPFCDELLGRYRADERVMAISGTNPLLNWREDTQSYFFSRQATLWGWATWQRAWRLYDDSMSRWRDPAVREQARTLMPDEKAYEQRARRYQQAYEKSVDTWDYAWSLACLAHDGLTIIPATNLVANIGFRLDATHTNAPLALGANMPTAPLRFPWQPPAKVAPDSEYERLYLDWWAGKPAPWIVLRYARRALVDGQPLRANLLLRALLAAHPTIADDPYLMAAQAAALDMLESRRHAQR